MIFYFSGTGNSYAAAKSIADKQNDRLLSIARENEKQDAEYAFGENELLGFVYPVYAWGPPKIVLDFIGKMKVLAGKPYVFSLSTCGGQEGNTTRCKKRCIEKDWRWTVHLL